MAFAHRDLAFNQNFIGIMDDPVHDCLRDWTFNIGIRIDPVVPLVRFILCAKDNRAFFASGFYNLQEIVLNAECIYLKTEGILLKEKGTWREWKNYFGRIINYCRLLDQLGRRDRILQFWLR